MLQIQVCWINPNTSKEEARKLVRQAVDATWGATETVRFVGWGLCRDGETGGVRIKIADEGPRSYVGRIADKKAVSMWLNFTFDAWSTDCRNCDETVSPITWERCVYSIAVHEFGHILGFYHEHDRLFHGVKYYQLSEAEFAARKAECEKRNETAPTTKFIPSDPILTAYDPKSVMNYCFEIYDHLASLSKWDKEGVSLAYGNGNKP